MSDKMKNDSGEVSPVDYFEQKESLPPDSIGPEADDHGFSLEEQRKIMWRLDRRLILGLGVMYCISLMDRSNLGSAIIAGMGTELILIGNRYVSLTPTPADTHSPITCPLTGEEVSWTVSWTDQSGSSRSSRSSSSAPTSSSNPRPPSSCASWARESIWRASRRRGAAS